MPAQRPRARRDAHEGGRPCYGIFHDVNGGVCHAASVVFHDGYAFYRRLRLGAVLYLPIQVDGALFYAADPHFVQGDGEVALTALEGSLRSTFRLTVLKAGDPALPMKTPMKNPFAETKGYWIPIGLNEDLDEAMKDATRQAVAFLEHIYGMDGATALAYLSAGADFQVTQVVDRVKGVNGMIRKADFAGAKMKGKPAKR